MKLYLTTWDAGQDQRPHYRFTGTQAEQKLYNKGLKAEGEDILVSIEVDVPTDKTGLIQFLNDYELPKGRAE